MSQPKINLKQNIKHTTAQYGPKRVMKHFTKVLINTRSLCKCYIDVFFYGFVTEIFEVNPNRVLLDNQIFNEFSFNFIKSRLLPNE